MIMDDESKALQGCRRRS